ncbi:MAG TPA: type IA DNA topoisomerase [Candidatus Poseidoniales archaeon]|nr:type IA DNA topoisomerase [Candidatus Poseidoniales archaeon]
MAILIIAEKPSVAEDVARVLGANEKNPCYWHGTDIFVTWAIGHLLELQSPEEYDDKYRRWSLEHLPIIPDEFVSKPKSQSSRKKQLKGILTILKKEGIDEIVNVCDAAREGELIFSEIIKHSGTEVNCTRMWLQSMTAAAIQKAYDERRPAAEYSGLRDAAVARAEADWLIGMSGSRAITIRLPNERDRSPYSVGRVQTPTLAILVDRELSHLSHIPEPFWTIKADLISDAASWTATWGRNSGKNPERITTSDELAEVQAALEGEGACEVMESKKERQEYSPLSFDLTTLQRHGSNLWRWSAKYTLDIAQTLYEEYKLITYPRTDSRHLPTDMRDSIDELITELSKQDDYSEHCRRLADDGLTNTARNFNDAKVSDHYAVIPTGNNPPANLPAPARQLYDHITRRFLASFHPHATWLDAKRVATKNEQILTAKASTLEVAGWRAVIPKPNSSPEGWGVLAETPCIGEIAAIEVQQKQTKPAPRMKDAGVLSAMENAGKIIDDEEFREAISEKGLGTPATRADHIEKLISHSYIERLKSGGLRATAKGIRLIEVLRRIPVNWLSSPELTGEMESRLSGVQQGTFDSAEYMMEINHKVIAMVESVKGYESDTLYPHDQPLGDCPVCDGKVYEGMLNYHCQHNKRGKGCPFAIWKDSRGRYFDIITATRFLNDGKVDDLHGFVNRSSEEFTASIIRNEDHKLEFLSQGPSKEELSAAEELIGCPTCEGGSIKVTDTHWACDNGACKSKPLARNICKREMQTDEALRYFTEGETELIEDFISKRGKPFTAKLVNRGGRLKFEFPPRQNNGRSNLPQYEVTEGVVGTYSQRGSKVPIIESATHFIAADNDQGIELEIPRTFAKRELLRDECKTLVEQGKVGPLDDFISKKGKPFSAILVLNRSGNVKFRFD